MIFIKESMISTFIYMGGTMTKGTIQVDIGKLELKIFKMKLLRKSLEIPIIATGGISKESNGCVDKNWNTLVQYVKYRNDDLALLIDNTISYLESIKELKEKDMEMAGKLNG